MESLIYFAASASGWSCGYGGYDMARKRGGSGAKNGRDSNPKYLGIKASSGTIVTAGTIIARQRGTNIHPGENVGVGGDYTLFATADGKVTFHNRRGRKLVSVI